MPLHPPPSDLPKLTILGAGTPAARVVNPANNRGLSVLPGPGGEQYLPIYDTVRLLGVRNVLAARFVVDRLPLCYALTCGRAGRPLYCIKLQDLHRLTDYIREQGARSGIYAARPLVVNAEADATTPAT